LRGPTSKDRGKEEREEKGREEREGEWKGRKGPCATPHYLEEVYAYDYPLPAL